MGKLIFTKLNHHADKSFTCGNPSIDKKVRDSYFLFFDVGILYVPQGIQYGKHRDPRNYQENTHQSVQGNS